MGQVVPARRVPCLLMAIASGLVACQSGTDSKPASSALETKGRLVLSIDSAQTATNGQRCDLTVTARNDIGADALNLQTAWMAQTEGFGIISDYQMFGDFTAGETRALQITVAGAPCDAVKDLKLTRAVCVVGPAQEPPQSCAEKVLLDGGGVVTVRH